MGAFRSTKICGLKFRQFHVPNGTVLSGYADPTQATSRLVIVLVSRIQKSGIGDNSFVRWKGKFRSNRPKWPDRSKRTTFKAGSEYSGRTKPKLSLPFDVPYEISGILGWMESALYHLDDVWAALFVTVSFRWLFVIFFLDSNALDDIASTYSGMCVVYNLFCFVNEWTDKHNLASF